jgi:hypothetical protein
VPESTDKRDLPAVISDAISALRLAGTAGRTIIEGLRNSGKAVRPALAVLPFLVPAFLSAATDRKLELAERLYEITKHPAHVWRAYYLCRAAGREIPAWVLEYFDRVSKNFLELCDLAERGEVIKERAAAIAEALEMKKPGRSGRGNILVAPEGPEGLAWLAIARDVKREIEKGTKEMFAMEAVAKARGVSESTVWRAWDRAKTNFPELEAISPIRRISER